MKAVLVVDDDPRMRQLYCDIVEEAGYGTLQAHRGGTAALLLEVHTVDLIVLDIRMPGIRRAISARPGRLDPDRATGYTSA